LKNEYDIELSQHEQKAALLWNSFKQRLGQPLDTHMICDLQNMMTPTDLSEVEVPFTKEETDDVIKHMLNDKALGLMDLMVCSSRKI
jgi:hypothetical protein